MREGMGDGNVGWRLNARDYPQARKMERRGNKIVFKDKLYNITSSRQPLRMVFVVSTATREEIFLFLTEREICLL